MAQIDLHSYYPWYKRGSLIDVPDEIADDLAGEKRKEAAYLRRLFRYRAHYSLDCRDGIEFLAMYRSLTPDDAYECKQTVAQLYTAIATLPDKQAKRVYAHFILGMSKAAIARAEGVGESNIRKSIDRALKNLKFSLQKLL